MGEIETIGAYAFYNCSLVEYFNTETQYKIEVPNTVNSIGSYAFNGMVLIIDVNVADSVESIESNAFKGCNAIEKITLPFIGKNVDSTSSLGYIGVSNGSLKYVEITNDTTIPAAAFSGWSNLETIIIPETVESIGSSAFYNCSGLKQLNSETDGEFNIPKSVTTIADYTFYGCSQAVEFTMGEIETIGAYAFYNCSLVEYFNTDTQYKIEIPNTVTSIGSYTFNGMVLITEVYVPDSVESIGVGAFKGCNAIEKITLPFVGSKDGVVDYTSVFGYIFGYNKSNESGWINGPITPSVEFINEKTGTIPSGYIWQFSNVTNKDSVDHKIRSYYYSVPETIKEVVITVDTTIPAAAFNGCSFIEKITLPQTVESIGSCAFQNCSAVVSNTYISKISSVWTGNTASSYHSGIGTSADPYIIFTSAEFAYFAQQVNNGNSYDNTYFKLSSNIRLNNKEFNVIGSIDNPFNGHFDGDGFKIRDFIIAGTSNYVGLFGYVNGTIENVGITNVSITSTSTSNGKYYAGVVAYLGEQGVLKNIYSTGTVTNNAAYYSYAGGLVGCSVGLIENSYSTCNVVAKSSSLFAYAGGLVGYLEGTINDCYATGNVTANGANDTYSRNGGLVGDKTKNSVINNCYRTDTQKLIKYNSSDSMYNSDGTIETIENIKKILNK